VAGFVKLASCLHLVPSLRMSGTVFLLLLYVLWRGRGRFFLYFCLCVSHTSSFTLSFLSLMSAFLEATSTYTGFSSKRKPFSMKLSLLIMTENVLFF